MKILLVEDDYHTSELLSATLSTHHYAVDVITDGLSGLEMATRWSYDLILLDVLLPKINGIEICRRLRAQGCQTPILILTAKDSNEDVITGLDAGADDYVAKSCNSSQLLARVRALLRRSGNMPPSPVLTWGLLCLDPALAQVTYNQTEIALRPKEYCLLELFLRHPQRVLSRGAIIDHLWSLEETPVEGSVTNLIKDLRQRLKSAGMTTELIETVYGMGYRLKPAPQQHQLVDMKTPAGKASSSAAVTWDDWAEREQRVKTIVQQVTERFQVSLEQRIAVLQAADRSLQAGKLSIQQQNAARIQAHKLAGGLGTFGYVNASKIADAIEQLLDRSVAQSADLGSQFSHLLEQLQQELTTPQTQEAAAPSAARR